MLKSLAGSLGQNNAAGSGGQLSQGGRSRVDLVANRDARRCAYGKVHVHARAEADEAVALAARKAVAAIDVAQDTSRNEPGYLYAGKFRAGRARDVQRAALVLQRSLVELGVDEAAGVVPLVVHRAVHRAAVRVHVEHIHENADLERIAFEIRIARPLDGDDPAVGG